MFRKRPRLELRFHTEQDLESQRTKLERVPPRGVIFPGAGEASDLLLLCIEGCSIQYSRIALPVCTAMLVEHQDQSVRQVEVLDSQLESSEKSFQRLGSI